MKYNNFRNRCNDVVMVILDFIVAFMIFTGFWLLLKLDDGSIAHKS